MSERILLVDDEPMVQDTVGRFLDGLGFEIVAALDGKEAVATLRSSPVDAMVLDLQLPRMSGLDVLRHIRRQQLVDGVIIVMTGHGSASALAFDSLRLGAAGFLAKPFELAVLGSVLENELALRRCGVPVRSDDSQRGHPRMVLSVPIEIDISSLGVTIRGTTLNLSCGGVLANVDREVAVGALVTVRFPFFGGGKIRHGSVRRVGHTDTGCQVAVEFDELLPGFRELQPHDKKAER